MKNVVISNVDSIENVVISKLDSMENVIISNIDFFVLKIVKIELKSTVSKIILK
jgi:hypothetical protein